MVAHMRKKFVMPAVFVIVLAFSFGAPEHIRKGSFSMLHLWAKQLSRKITGSFR